MNKINHNKTDRKTKDKSKDDYFNRHPSTIKELTEKGESNPDTLRDADKDDTQNVKPTPISRENVISHTFLTEPRKKDSKQKENLPIIISNNNNKQLASIKDHTFKSSSNEDDDDDDDEEEDNEEEENEENKPDEYSNQGTRSKLKEEFNLREPAYRQKIEQLKNELLEEKNQSILKNTNNSFNTIISELKLEIQIKNSEITKLTKANSNQRKKLDELSKEADNRLKSINYRQISKRKYKQSSNNYDKTNVENTIKLKDKQLNNALSLVEILSKDNVILKTKFNSLRDTKTKTPLIDQKKEDETELTHRQTKLKQLKKEVDEHLHCKKTRQTYEQNIKLIKDDIKHLKIKNEALKQIIKDKEYIINNPPEKKSIDLLLNNQKNNRQKVLLKQRFPTESDDSQMANTTDQTHKIEKLLTPNELNAVRCLFISKADYDRIVKYIITMRTFLLSMETKHKNDIKKNLEKMNDLDDQIDYMTLLDSNNESKKTVYQTQLSECKTNVTNYNKKINEIKLKITNMNADVKEKENQIKTLTIKLTSLRTMLQNEKSSQLDKTITQYIVTVKNETN